MRKFWLSLLLVMLKVVTAARREFISGKRAKPKLDNGRDNDFYSQPTRSEKIRACGTLNVKNPVTLAQMTKSFQLGWMKGPIKFR